LLSGSEAGGPPHKVQNYKAFYPRLERTAWWPRAICSCPICCCA